MRLIIVLGDPERGHDDVTITHEFASADLHHGQSPEVFLARMAYELGARFGPAYRTGTFLKSARVDPDL